MPSSRAIGRILRQAERSLAAQKMHWPPFALLQIDVRDLKDLPGYRELIPFGLPRYQFTARVVPGRRGRWPLAVNDLTYALPRPSVGAFESL